MNGDFPTEGLQGVQQWYGKNTGGYCSDHAIGKVKMRGLSSMLNKENL